MPGPNPQFNSDAYAPDRLHAGDKKLVTDVITVVSGETVVRGHVLGKVTASGKYLISLNAAVDGSEVARCVASQAIDASGGDKLGGVYLQGEFDAAEVTFGAGQTLANTLDDLAGFGVHLKTSVSA